MAPNGVNTSKIELVSLEDKARLKEELGLSTIILFYLYRQLASSESGAFNSFRRNIVDKFNDCIFLVVGV